MVKEVEIIGEAAAKVTSETKSRYPEIPWQDMALMRNRLIHVYFDVDLEVVWETIQKDLPDLKRNLQAINFPEAREKPAIYRAGKPKAKKRKKR